MARTYPPRIWDRPETVDAVEFVHPACPECHYGTVSLCGHDSCLKCSVCGTVFVPFEED